MTLFLLSLAALLPLIPLRYVRGSEKQHGSVITASHYFLILRA
ncbi:MAG TPA: hypothetical protein VE999_02060 [Gemmataceae bacterium]|nr:hypothetical protein [Gemmataceae bacterium]